MFTFLQAYDMTPTYIHKEQSPNQTAKSLQMTSTKLLETIYEHNHAKENVPTYVPFHESRMVTLNFLLHYHGIDVRVVYLGYGDPSGPAQSVPCSASPQAYFSLGPQSANT